MASVFAKNITGCIKGFSGYASQKKSSLKFTYFPSPFNELE